MNAQPERRDRNLRRRLLPRRWALACALALAVSGQAQADAVTDWNTTAGAVAPRFGGPAQQDRAMAMVHIAIHDALNSIDPRFDSYASVPPADPNTPPDVAVAAAAHRVLMELLAGLPDSQAKTDAITLVANAYSLAVPLPYDSAETLGIAAGEAAAIEILEMRTGDGSATPHTPAYNLVAGPGVYQQTPNSPAPQFTGWAVVTPFAMNSPSQFRSDPGEIFALASAAYARDYNEVKQMGDALVRGTAPASEESDIARFWPGGGSNWNRVARTILAAPAVNPHLDLAQDLWENARLFALLNIALADGSISVFDTKYTYNFWRPVTAIRWADDGNPATESDATWLPFLVTPPYPDYVCGLTTASGAGTEVLRRYFGTDDVGYALMFNAPGVTLPAPLAALPPKAITRGFTSLSEAAAESASARVFAGIHFRSGCVQGVRQGAKVGRFVVQHYLNPLK